MSILSDSFFDLKESGGDDIKRVHQITRLGIERRGVDVTGNKSRRSDDHH